MTDLFLETDSLNLAPITEEDGKLLLLKIVEQAIRDYINLARAISGQDREDYLSAESFLFLEDHWIDFGGQEYRLAEILDLLDMDIDWFRQRIIRARKKRESNRV